MQNIKNGTRHIGKLRETYYQTIITKKTGGSRKYLPCGITDVTTHNKHIEIKKWHNWKHSVAQLLSYNFYDNKPILEAHMFGEYPEQKKIIAKKVFEHYNIIVVDLDYLNILD